MCMCVYGIIVLYRWYYYCISSFISLQRLRSFLFIVFSIPIFFGSYAPSLHLSLLSIYLFFVAFMDTKTYTDTRLSYFIIIKVLRLYACVWAHFFFFIIVIITITAINIISQIPVHYNTTLWTFQHFAIAIVINVRCIISYVYVCVWMRDLGNGVTNDNGFI